LVLGWAKKNHSDIWKTVLCPCRRHAEWTVSGSAKLRSRYDQSLTRAGT